MANSRLGLRTRPGLIRDYTEGQGATSYLLDLYPSAQVAFSVRKLRDAYTGSAFRVRRSSDNVEQDIGFNGDGNLDETALTTFIGANNGFVVTWYDQSGNANNATQSTAANQAKIVTAGTIEKINGKAALLFDGTNDGYNLTNSVSSGQPSSQFIVQKMVTDVSFMGLCGAASGGANTLYGPTIFPKYSNTFFMRWADGYISKTGESSTSQLLITGIALNGSGKYYRNNSSQTVSYVGAPLSNNYTQLGYSNDYSNAYAQECVFYTTDIDSNVSGIHQQINGYYAIY